MRLPSCDQAAADSRARVLVSCLRPVPFASTTKSSPSLERVGDDTTSLRPLGDQRPSVPGVIRPGSLPSRPMLQIQERRQIAPRGMRLKLIRSWDGSHCASKSHIVELVSVRRPLPSAPTIWMSKSLIGVLPGEAPSKATSSRSGERRGRFAFWSFERRRCGSDPSGRIAQIDGNGSSLQYTITPSSDARALPVPSATIAQSARPPRRKRPPITRLLHRLQELRSLPAQRRRRLASLAPVALEAEVVVPERRRAVVVLDELRIRLLEVEASRGHERLLVHAVLDPLRPRS